MNPQLMPVYLNVAAIVLLGFATVASLILFLIFRFRTNDETGSTIWLVLTVVFSMSFTAFSLIFVSHLCVMWGTTGTWWDTPFFLSSAYGIKLRSGLSF